MGEIPEPSLGSREPTFKWQDALGLVGALLAVGGMSDMPLILRISCFVACAICLPISFGSHKNWNKHTRWGLSTIVLLLMGYMSWQAISKSSERIPTAQENAEATAKLFHEQPLLGSKTEEQAHNTQLSEDQLQRSHFKPTEQITKDQRVLTEYQETRLKTLLSRSQYHGNTVIILVTGELESWTYAKSIASVFSKSGWNVIGPFAANPNELAMDIQVSTTNLYPQPSQVSHDVLELFKFVQLKCRSGLILDPDIHIGNTVVWIGPKSPDNVNPDGYVPQTTHLEDILKSHSIKQP